MSNVLSEGVELTESGKGQEIKGNPGVFEQEPETLYHRDDALLYIAYVMLICAAPIPGDRWHCSLTIATTLG